MKKICTNGGFESSYLFSAEAVGNNEDLIRQIFLHLPVRSLIRFTLVSKSWSSLISNAEFAQDRTKRLDPNSTILSGLFFYNSLTNSQEIESVSLDEFPIQLSRVRARVGVRIPFLSFLNTASELPELTILQSCNGLLFCQFTSEYYEDEYCVCNPTTQKYRILPQFTLDDEEEASGFTLAFDPSKSLHYKVVCLIHESPQLNSRIRIYSSETDKWTNSTRRSSQRFYAGPAETGFYWNDAVHWVEQRGTTHYSYRYDLEKECDYRKEYFSAREMLPNPQSYFDNPTLRYFGESKGYLHCVYVRTCNAKKFQILERDRETLKWVVKFRVHLCHLLSKFPDISVSGRDDYVEYAFSILSVFKGEKEEDSALILTIPDKVVSYNLHSKTGKILSELPFQEVVHTSRYHYCTAFNFIESFASV